MYISAVLGLGTLIRNISSQPISILKLFFLYVRDSFSQFSPDTWLKFVSHFKAASQSLSVLEWIISVLSTFAIHIHWYQFSITSKNLCSYLFVLLDLEQNLRLFLLHMFWLWEILNHFGNLFIYPTKPSLPCDALSARNA